MVSASVLDKDTVKPFEYVGEDTDWTQDVELQIQPHPRLPENSRLAVEKEFGMCHGVFVKKSERLKRGTFLIVGMLIRRLMLN